MVKLLVIPAFLFMSLICYASVAASVDKEAKNTLTQVNEFTLRSEIITLVELATTAPNKAHNIVEELASDTSIYNYAEQYLIVLAQAKIKQDENQHEMVITLIEQAKPLTEYIAEKQLNLPIFSEAYLVLATSYTALKDYKNAYQNKKSFVDHYNDYSDTKREYAIEKLTDKYEVANKNQENELLANQNKLKALHLNAVKKEQQDLQRKIMLIFSTILLFFLLFLRQFKVRKKLLLLSKTDSLTALLNRTGLFKEGNKLVKKAKEEQLELSVLLFDIDFFKLINEDFGHSVGDAVLKKIAELVSETMRSRDVLARLGGEQFVAILPSSDLDHAKAIAVRVLEKIAQYNFNKLGVKRTITLSLGVANIKNTNAAFDDILHAADLAMYQAKAQGRNQVVSYESIVEDQERRHR
ncbi:GGDEF domain-containing protein [Colwellia sp. E150_009]